MTLSESASLTPEQLRVAVAERLGDKCSRCNGTGKYFRYGDHDYFRMDPSGKLGKQKPIVCDHCTEDDQRPYAQLYPNYPESLDACATFEATLIEPFSGPENDTIEGAERLKERYDQYEENLKAVCVGLGSPWHATATQRCRAFLAVTYEVTENRNE